MSDKLDAVLARLDAMEARMAAVQRHVGAPGAETKARHADTGRLTSADVRGATLTTTRMATGYSIPEVDELLDRIADEFDRLTGERDALR